jgi:hypothetical protein
LKQKVAVAKAQKNSETDNTKFITDTFLEAAHNKAFHQFWILINHYYLPPIDEHFSSDDLLNAV